MSAATCLACGADVAVVRSARSGLVAVVDGMPTKTGVAAVDFRSGTYRLPQSDFNTSQYGEYWLLHRFHECGYVRQGTQVWDPK